MSSSGDHREECREGQTTYDWATFFDQPFQQRALKGIKSMHHMTFTSSKPGYVIVKDSVDAPERDPVSTG